MAESQFIHVSPVTVTSSRTIAKIVPQIVSVQIFSGASIKMNYFDSDSHYIPAYLYNLPEYIELTREEYASWGTDDTDLIELILQKLNFTAVATPPIQEDPNSIVDIPDDDIS